MRLQVVESRAAARGAGLSLASVGLHLEDASGDHANSSISTAPSRTPALRSPPCAPSAPRAPAPCSASPLLYPAATLLHHGAAPSTLGISPGTSRSASAQSSPSYGCPHAFEPPGHRPRHLAADGCCVAGGRHPAASAPSGGSPIPLAESARLPSAAAVSTMSGASSDAAVNGTGDGSIARRHDVLESQVLAREATRRYEAVLNEVEDLRQMMGSLQDELGAATASAAAAECAKVASETREQTCRREAEALRQVASAALASELKSKPASSAAFSPRSPRFTSRNTSFFAETVSELNAHVKREGVDDGAGSGNRAAADDRPSSTTPAQHSHRPRAAMRASVSTPSSAPISVGCPAPPASSSKPERRTSDGNYEERPRVSSSLHPSPPPACSSPLSSPALAHASTSAPPSTPGPPAAPAISETVTCSGTCTATGTGGMERLDRGTPSQDSPAVARRHEDDQAVAQKAARLLSSYSDPMVTARMESSLEQQRNARRKAYERLKASEAVESKRVTW